MTAVHIFSVRGASCGKTEGGTGMAGIGKRAAKGFARLKEALMEYAYLVTLGAVIAVVVGAALYTDHIKTQQQAAAQAAAQAMEVDATATPRVTPLPTIAPLTLGAAAFSPRVAVVRPASGEIVRAYSAEPVRWETLDAWQAHEAIDIAGEADGPVCSAMDGVVADAAMDDLWGWRVTIAHTDGSTGVYAGLALAFVKPDEAVSRGQEIGTLLPSVPCEAELGPHLHFELMKNGTQQDPEGILTE